MILYTYDKVYQFNCRKISTMRCALVLVTFAVFLDIAELKGNLDKLFITPNEY